jgi:uncharacterized membrane protein
MFVEYERDGSHRREDAAGGLTGSSSVVNVRLISRSPMGFDRGHSMEEREGGRRLVYWILAAFLASIGIMIGIGMALALSHPNYPWGWMMGGGASGAWMVAAGVAAALILLLLVLVFVFSVAAEAGYPRPSARTYTDPVDELRLRLAQGQISADDYRKTLAELRSG